MKCPRCNVEMRISNSGYVSNNGSVFRKLSYMCLNKNCANYGTVVKSDYIPLDVTVDPEAEVEESE